MALYERMEQGVLDLLLLSVGDSSRRGLFHHLKSTLQVLGLAAGADARRPPQELDAFEDLSSARIRCIETAGWATWNMQ